MVYDMLTTSGGVLGAAFDPLTVDTTRWGCLTLQIDCNGSEEQGFGAGSLILIRLPLLADLN